MPNTYAPLEALRLLIEEEIEQVPFRPYVLLSKIKKEDEYQSAIKWNVDVGGAVAQGRATTSDASTTNTDTMKGASLPIGDRVLGHSFSILRNDIVQAKRTGQGAIRNLFAEHIQTAFDVILPEANRVLYQGTGNAASHGVFGLESVTAIANYAGIDTVTYPEWSSIVTANGGVPRSLTADHFSQMQIDLERRGVMYDSICTTPEIREKYKKLFASDRSLTVNQVNGAADIDFSEVSYGGKPIYTDTQCPNGVLYFVDTRSMVLKTFSLAEGTNLMDNEGRMIGTQTAAQKTKGLNFLAAELPSSNPHAVKFEISLQMQLRIRQPKRIGVLRDIQQ
jgi:hypothetical protein